MARQGKLMSGIGWTLSIMVALLMCSGLPMYFIKRELSTEGMAKYGYPSHVALPIVIAAFVSAVLYLIPRTAPLGAVIMTGYLGGAVATHVRAGEPFTMAVIVAIVMWFGLFFRDHHVRHVLPLHRGD
jgi:hypothetical protein